MDGITHLERHTQSIIRKKNELIQSKVSMSNLKKIYFKKTIIQETELKLCMFISEHNLSFRTLEHLSKLIQICPDSKIVKEIKCSRTKNTYILKEHVTPCSMMEHFKNNKIFTNN